MSKLNNNIELLSPAGDFESLKAAVQNGANAIYLGGTTFSARASAKNFNREELAEALFYAHFRNVKIYVTVNTILDEGELKESLEYIDYLYRIGVDGIIIQDLGLIKIIRENYPDLDLHSSTQMTINSLEAAKAMEDLGFTRVVLARETPLEEIKLISENTDLEIEFFAHGALCVSYSGQCLMSSMIGGRSGNRGRCAQPCRKSYQVVKEDGQELQVDRAYLISPKDLNTSEHLEKLGEVGVTSIKIEGRMKRPDYVATVTKIYRKALDQKAYIDQKELAQAFNRGFTKGLPLGDFGREYANPNRQNNQGVKIGKVLSQNRGRTSMFYDKPLNKDDLLEFIKINGKRQTFKSPDNFNPGQVDFIIPFDVKEKSEIRRIIDQDQVERAKESYQGDHLQRPLNLKFIGHIGQYPKLIGEDGLNSLEVKGPEKIQEARKAPLTKEGVYDNLDRLGNTSYRLGKVEIDLGEKLFIPISIINDLRRDLVSGLGEKLKLSYQRQGKKLSYYKEKLEKNYEKLGLSLSFSNKDQMKGVDFSQVDNLYLRFIDKDLYLKFLDQGIKVYYRTGKILNHRDYKEIKSQLKNIDYSGIVIDNLGGFKGFKGEKLIGDYGLNVFNSESGDLTRDLGAGKIIASPELTLSQLNTVNSHSYQDLEAIAYGFIRVMTMEHCPFSTIKNCSRENRDCQVCNFATGHLLRDEMSVDFPTERIGNYSLIYNSYPISMVDKLEDLRATGVKSILLDFTIEKSTREMVEEFKKALNKESNNLNDLLIEKYGNINYGHYYRGID